MSAKRHDPQREKQEIKSRLDAMDERVKERKSKKATAESVAQDLKEAREARRAKAEAREKAAPGTRGRMIRIGVGVALLVATGAVAVTASNSVSKNDSTISANEATIAQQKGDLAYIKPAGGQAGLEKSLTDSFADATKKANAVAKLQQGFAPLLRQASTEEVSDNGAPGKGFVASVEHRKELAPYFAKATLIASDDDAYKPGSANVIGEGQVDPRFAWYTRYDKAGVASDAKAYTWSVASVSPSSVQDPGYLEVTWLCQDANGDLLAWAVGYYSVEDKVFDSLSVGTTTIGDANGKDKEAGA